MAKVMTRARRQKRIRNKIRGTGDKPRLSVFRSNKHIYAQVIDDLSSKTLAAASTVSEKLGGQKTESAKKVGEAIARVCKEKGIEKVVFDRNGFLYHGRVQAVAEGAREGGLQF